MSRDFLQVLSIDTFWEWMDELQHKSEQRREEFGDGLPTLVEYGYSRALQDIVDMFTRSEENGAVHDVLIDNLLDHQGRTHLPSEDENPDTSVIDDPI